MLMSFAEKNSSRSDYNNWKTNTEKKNVNENYEHSKTSNSINKRATQKQNRIAMGEFTFNGLFHTLYHRTNRN